MIFCFLNCMTHEHKNLGKSSTVGYPVSQPWNESRFIVDSASQSAYFSGITAGQHAILHQVPHRVAVSLRSFRLNRKGRSMWLSCFRTPRLVRSTLSASVLLLGHGLIFGQEELVSGEVVISETVISTSESAVDSPASESATVTSEAVTVVVDKPEAPMDQDQGDAKKEKGKKEKSRKKRDHHAKHGQHGRGPGRPMAKWSHHSGHSSMRRGAHLSSGHHGGPRFRGPSFHHSRSHSSRWGHQYGARSSGRFSARPWGGSHSFSRWGHGGPGSHFGGMGRRPMPWGPFSRHSMMRRPAFHGSPMSFRGPTPGHHPQWGGHRESSRPSFGYSRSHESHRPEFGPMRGGNFEGRSAGPGSHRPEGERHSFHREESDRPGPRPFGPPSFGGFRGPDREHAPEHRSGFRGFPSRDGEHRAEECRGPEHREGDHRHEAHGEYRPGPDHHRGPNPNEGREGDHPNPDRDRSDRDSDRP